ncbi:MAG: SUMF1/EgtB/PvdO family nonheme iron enzyme [Bacteroidales bacterium]
MKAVSTSFSLINKKTYFTFIAVMILYQVNAQRQLHSSLPCNVQSGILTNEQESLSQTSISVSEALVPGGEFEMGDHFGFVDPSHPSDEIPLHLVKVDSMYMAKTETTNQQFLTFLNSMLASGSIQVLNKRVYLVGDTNTLCYTYQYASYYSIGYSGTAFSIVDFRANHPVVGVMWYGAAVYCNWLSSQNGLQQCYALQTWNCDFTKTGYRLPTEAEWEYAARGGNTSPYYNYPNGNSVILSQANLPNSGDPYETGSYPLTTPVGFYDGSLKNKTTYNWPGSTSTYQTTSGINGFSLSDMQGNVWELINDWYGQNYYSSSTYDNPTGPATGTTMPDGKTYRGMRGGNWYNGYDLNGVNDGHSRVSNRNPSYYRGPQDPNHPWYHIGFRVARNLSIAAGTVGLFINDTANAYVGFTLFAPKQNTMTYLINNEGRVVHEWTASTYPPGQAVYLLENGHLLRTCMTQSQLGTGGGEGGRIEEYDWNDNLVWSLDYSTSSYMQHHDIKKLPNGNIIMLVVEKKTYAQVLAAGFDPTKLNSEIQQKGYMLPDCIIEIQPTYPSGGTVVWEWHVWDHLIQDYSSAKSNYGVVSAHPELVDADGDHRILPLFWNHMNSIDYNPEFDQIAMSVRGNSEVWIVDHSTTTSQSASHAGGIRGKGGDLLYRWGNPLTYGKGTVNDEKYFEQHDVEWVKPNRPGAGNLTCYNNGIGRTPLHSTVDEIIPPVDASGNYSLTTGAAYGPTGFTWSYAASPPEALYSENISGAQRQPNGNTIICEGGHGDFTEVTSTGDLVWRYICPVDDNGPLMQGETIPTNPVRPDETMNSVFRIYRYAPDYPAFTGKDLTPGDYIELYSYKTVNLTLLLEGLCAGGNTMNQAQDEAGSQWTSPIADKITVELHSASDYSSIIYTASNINLYTNGAASFTVPDTYNGSYYLAIRHRNSIITVTAYPVSFSTGIIDYNFTNTASKAYGSNMTLLASGKWAIYSGDVNQDGIIDSGDMAPVDNLSTLATSGYFVEDANGDGLIDSGDMAIIDNNSTAAVSIAIP